MRVINDWVKSELSNHFKHRKKIHHIYKLDENTLVNHYEHLVWYFNYLNLDHLDNQTMTFKHYNNSGRDSYHFFKLSKSKMVLIRKVDSGNEYLDVINFRRTTSRTYMEIISSYDISKISKFQINDIQQYIKKYSPIKIKTQINETFNFAGKKHRQFSKLKGDLRL